MTDASHNCIANPALENYRGYLRTLTQLQVGRGMQAKVDASDIVQQTLLDAHVALADFRGTGEAELKAWLRTILANNLHKAIRGWRTQKRDARREISLAQQIERSSMHLDAFLVSDRSSPSEAVLRKERAESLTAALSQLPDDQRLAVILKHFHAWSMTEIAEHMERSEAAIAGLLKRGLDRLRVLMEADGSTFSRTKS